MTRKYFLTLLLAGSLMAGAQSPNQSFQDFRNEILGNYQEFRQTLLDDYADFLNGEWHEYRSLKGEERYSSPKPVKAPQVDVPAEPAPLPLPTPKPAPKPAPAPSVEPLEPAPTPSPAPSPGPVEEVTTVTFYELPIQVPRIDFNIMQSLRSTSDYAKQWTQLADADVAARLLPSIKAKVKEMGLNDYLALQFVKSYIESLFPGKDDSSRFSAIHYLLANMGYDVRIAASSDGIPILLVPFDQMVYGKTYMMLDGKKYYLFAPDSFDMDELGNKRIYTCSIPDNVQKGKVLGLVVGKLNIPYSPHSFELKGDRLTLNGEMNRNLIPILYKYPQMGVDGFAMSNLEPDLREKLTEQVRSQLAGLPEDEAVNALLQFTQKAFQYATDEDYHGFEKPYFIEETLFYPKNDCEDRAIFYTYFLWNALGKRAQLISFPGHEAASVSLQEPASGASYSSDGATFYISDPTYIGSTTGMIMPQYKNQTPTIDYSYK